MQRIAQNHTNTHTHTHTQSTGAEPHKHTNTQTHTHTHTHRKPEQNHTHTHTHTETHTHTDTTRRHWKCLANLLHHFPRAVKVQILCSHPNTRETFCAHGIVLINVFDASTGQEMRVRAR